MTRDAHRTKHSWLLPYSSHQYRTSWASKLDQVSLNLDCTVLSKLTAEKVRHVIGPCHHWAAEKLLGHLEKTFRG